MLRKYSLLARNRIESDDEYPESTVENATTSGLRLPSADHPWYCGRVASGRERPFERGLHRFGIHTYFPVYNRSIARAFDTYTREMPLFPGYVFVSLYDGQWPLIREKQSYKPQWLMVNGRPAQIPTELLEELAGREVNGFVRLPQTELKEGDEVEVTDGLMRGQRGLLASDPARRIVTLHLIAESYALQPTQVLTKLKIDREQVRRVSL